MRNVGHHRGEAHPGADADQERMRRAEQEEIGRQPRESETEAHRKAAEGERRDNAETVGETAEPDRARRKA
jgi:hypothetical protein